MIEAKCDKCGNWTECEEVVGGEGMYPICPICLTNSKENTIMPKLDDNYLTEEQENPELVEEPRKIYSFEVLNVASSMQHAIARTVQRIGRVLLDKNRKYGNSALDPIRVHSTSDSVEQIKVRADDKLSRLRSAQGDDAEDALFDYIGYLILLHIAEHQSEQKIDS